MSKSDQKQKVSIDLGGLAPPIEEQLKVQGFCLNLAPIDRHLIQKDARALTDLWIRGYISETELKKISARIYKKIMQNIDLLPLPTTMEKTDD
jgi:hypothetical protein